MAKALKVTIQSNNPAIAEKAKSILISLLGWVRKEAFLKNLHKSYQYFDLIKDFVTNIAEIRQLTLSEGYLAFFLDLLMGSDSILNGKDKKRIDFHSAEAIPVV